MRINRTIRSAERARLKMPIKTAVRKIGNAHNLFAVNGKSSEGKTRRAVMTPERTRKPSWRELLKRASVFPTPAV